MGGIQPLAASAKVLQTLEEISGTDGIATWPAAAAPGNAVSIAEAIRAIYDRQLGDGTNAGKSVKGIRVSKATAALPQTAAAAIFNVTVGRVLVTQIIGEVTTIIQTQANNTKLTSNPTTGTSLDLSAVLDISADEVGTLYGVTGTFANALLGANAGALEAQAKSIVVPIGAVDLDCAASNTGNVKWDLWYIPLDDGAVVAAA